MAETGARRPAKFAKVQELRPSTHGHSLIVKVLNSKSIRGAPQARQMRVAECIVGDDTGVIVFTARNDQVEVMKRGATVELRNAKVDMYRGSMRLAVDKWGIVKVADSPSELKIKEDNNMSLIEFDMVSIVE